mmetsp:Transcript_38005/g.85482  ORF Transcript_38005/g.85482 Transcript_38005/m.85482 type:complete len:320 (+) Transcript_38005:3-962(+)
MCFLFYLLLISINFLAKIINDVINWYPDLLGGVSVPDRYRAVILDRFKVNRHAERDANLVGPSVPPTDRPGLIPRAVPPHLKLLEELPCRQNERLLVLHQRQHRNFHGSDGRVEGEVAPLLAVHLVLSVGRADEGEDAPVDAEGGLDDMWGEPLACLLVKVVECLATPFGVTRQIKVPPGGNAHELLDTERKPERNIRARPCVMRQPVALVDIVPHQLVLQSDLEQKLARVRDPLLVVRLPNVIARWDEILDLHLLELPAPENEVPRRDLVPERLADLRDAEGELEPGCVEYILVVDEYTLCRLGAEVGHGRRVLHSSH